MVKKERFAKYRQTIKDPRVIAVAIVLMVLIAWLFYRSIYAFILFPVVFP